jgi:uncharacterized lipoprotein YddW (UPF0748 family)
MLASLPAAAATAPARHGVWVDIKLLQQDKAEIARYVLLARAAGLTTLYPAVYRYGCNYYNAPASPFNCGREDLLAKFMAVVKETAPEMKVTPWFERTLQMDPAKTQPALFNDTAAQEAPDARVDGYRVVNLDDPQVRRHMLQAVLALRAYGVDSVQIDDHLAYDVSPAHTGNDAFKAAPAVWRAKLTRFVNWLAARVHEQAPGFRVEIAQNPRSFADKTYLADWGDWKVDEVVVECYRPSGRASAYDPGCGGGRRGVAFLANGAELPDAEILAAARGLKDRGFVLFHLARLGDRPALVKGLGAVLKNK